MCCGNIDVAAFKDVVVKDGAGITAIDDAIVDNALTKAAFVDGAVVNDAIAKVEVEDGHINNALADIAVVDSEIINRAIADFGVVEGSGVVDGVRVFDVAVETNRLGRS